MKKETKGTNYVFKSTKKLEILLSEYQNKFKINWAEYEKTKSKKALTEMNKYSYELIRIERVLKTRKEGKKALVYIGEVFTLLFAFKTGAKYATNCAKFEIELTPIPKADEETN